jgi:HAMP domain-containing protein
LAVFDPIRRSLSAKISLMLALLLVVLLAMAATVTTVRQTRQLEADTLEKARLTAAMAARQYGDLFDNAIDSGLATVADVFDRHYVEIKGYDWGAHPKYHTRYDTLTDRAALVFQDRILEDPDFVYAVGADENGYVPTHNSNFQHRPEGVEKDLAGNRTKRLFNDPLELKAVQSLEPSLVQVIKRDTGELMWDVAVPISVKGKHWGAFRLGVSMVRIEARKWAFATTLVALLGAFALVTIAIMFLVVRRAVKPVVALTQAAEQISLGEGLDQSVKSTAVDELGQLANALERLRVSMKAAMGRLGGF